MENENYNMEETVTSQNNFSPEMTVTPAGKQALKIMSGWMRFIAVLGFIYCAFLFLGGLIMLLSGSLLSNGNFSAVPVKGISFAYLIIAVAFFFPSLLLNRSCNAINNALMMSNNEELEAGLINMKSYWKYIGIFAIIMIVMGVLMIPIMIAATV